MRTYFVRGLAVLLPTILTIWIIVWGYKFIQENIGVHINRGLVSLIILLGAGDPAGREQLMRFWVQGWGSLAGFLLAVVAVCLVGVALASVVGRTLWRAIEGLIITAPFLKRIYPYMKQFTDFFLMEGDRNRLPYSRVVAVEYPRKGIWAIGMVTGRGLGKTAADPNGELLTVFIPNSPMPATGFTILASRDQVVDLPLTIEEAFRFIASVGVVAPAPAGSGFLSKSEAAEAT